MTITHEAHLQPRVQNHQAYMLSLKIWNIIRIWPICLSRPGQITDQRQYFHLSSMVHMKAWSASLSTDPNNNNNNTVKGISRYLLWSNSWGAAPNIGPKGNGFRIVLWGASQLESIGQGRGYGPDTLIQIIHYQKFQQKMLSIANTQEWVIVCYQYVWFTWLDIPGRASNGQSLNSMMHAISRTYILRSLLVPGTVVVVPGSTRLAAFAISWISVFIEIPLHAVIKFTPARGRWPFLKAPSKQCLWTRSRHSI